RNGESRRHQRARRRLLGRLPHAPAVDRAAAFSDEHKIARKGAKLAKEDKVGSPGEEKLCWSSLARLAPLREFLGSGQLADEPVGQLASRWPSYSFFAPLSRFASALARDR